MTAFLPLAKTIQIGRKNKAECFFLSNSGWWVGEGLQPVRPPHSITRSKLPTLNHWHKSCSHLDRLHSGGGPNVNSRVIDADKGIGSQPIKGGVRF
jgi:hypothetical protein